MGVHHLWVAEGKMVETPKFHLVETHAGNANYQLLEKPKFKISPILDNCCHFNRFGMRFC